MSEEDPRYGCPTCLSVFRLGFSRCPIDGAALQKIEGDPLVGSLLADRYLIEACVGEGGMGRVYRARHQRMSRRFAIKILFGELATDSKMRARFAREAEAASRLSHPNVVSVIDFGETTEGLLYLAMDFVEGSELAEVIERSGPFPKDRVRNLATQLCEGLGHAHDEGIVHRDFKGENVILTHRNGEVPRIVDFGIAVMLEETDQRLTTQGLIIGTPAYMSPEQVTGKTLDARSDLFSLGVLMYEMLAGCKPFDGDPMSLARQNLAADPPSISERVPGLTVDPHLEAIALKLMAKLPEKRYQTAAEVLEALRPPPVSPTMTQARVTEPGDGLTQDLAAIRRPAWPFAVVAVLLLGGVGAFFGLRGDSSDAPRADLAAIDAGLAPIPVAPDAQMLAAASDAAPAPAASEEPDAGGVQVAATRPGKPISRPTPAKPTKGKPEVKPAEVKPAEVKPAEVKKPTPPADTTEQVDKTVDKKPPSTKELTALYVSVGETIANLQKSGHSDAGALRKQYAAIPLNDALRVPELRAEVVAKLRRLSKRANKAKEEHAN